jgi:hypothetical protein
MREASMLLVKRLILVHRSSGLRFENLLLNYINDFLEL